LSKKQYFRCIVWSAFVNANTATAPQERRNKDETAWVYAQVERFVATIATAAANK